MVEARHILFIVLSELRVLDIRIVDGSLSAWFRHLNLEVVLLLQVQNKRRNVRNDGGSRQGD